LPRPNSTRCQNRGEFSPLSPPAASPCLRLSRGRLSLADFPCFEAITGNFFKKRAINRRISGHRRREVDFRRVNSMACRRKINFPVIRDNRAF
jgi:hypothetical protein